MNGTSSHDHGEGGPPKGPGQSAHTLSTPPQLLCPACEQPLVHQQAITDRIDGRDGFACQACGGFFIYQDRAPKQRRTPDGPMKKSAGGPSSLDDAQDDPELVEGS